MLQSRPFLELAAHNLRLSSYRMETLITDQLRWCKPQQQLQVRRIDN